MSADAAAEDSERQRLSDDLSMGLYERYARAAAAAQIAADRGNVPRMRKAQQLQQSLLARIEHQRGDE